jgi:branched-chain amino acid transport system substrate-binding protein
MRWAFENLNLTSARLKRWRHRPAAGDQDQLRQPRGLRQGEDPAVGRRQVGGGVRLDRRQQGLIHPLFKATAAQYAKEKGITPACMKS